MKRMLGIFGLHVIMLSYTNDDYWPEIFRLMRFHVSPSREDLSLEVGIQKRSTKEAHVDYLSIQMMTILLNRILAIPINVVGRGFISVSSREDMEISLKSDLGVSVSRSHILLKAAC